MITPEIRGTKVIAGPFRLSYVHLLQKHSFDGDDANGKYSAVILIPKNETETVNAIKTAIAEAKKAGISGKWGGKEPKKFATPLRDGDDMDDDTYAGHYYINAKCSTRPGVVDRNMAPIYDEEEVYSGMWAIVSVTFFPFDVGINKGVACGLNNVIKWKDGEKLGGRVSAEADFANVNLSFDDDDDDL